LLNLDPAEIRRRNLIQPAQIPYKNQMGQTYDSGDFPRILAQALALSDYDGFTARRTESAARGRLRGRGISTFLEWTGGNVFEERVTLTVESDGHMRVFTGTQAMGQGIATSLAQVVADAMQLRPDDITVDQGDTRQGPGFGSVGSRSLFAGGSALTIGAEKLMRHLADLASPLLECPAEDIEYNAGRLRVKGTDRAVGLADVAKAQPGQRVFIESKSSVAGPSWPNACHVAEVEVDPATGVVDVVRYTSVDDLGRVVNPMVVRGQVEGGIVQGIGQALGEAVVYDPESGQNLTASFMDYTMPRAGLLPPIAHALDQSQPCKNNPLGVKGCGEIGTIGGTPTVIHAVLDALKDKGVHDIAMPATPARVWAALRG
jgi:aerobic carbon-monoxide dehydrogenase large subunit